MKFSTGAEQIELQIAHLVVAGWTGRDQAAVQHHIDELAALGVAPPSTTPLFYRVSHALLTQAETIEVLGPHSSGEAEPLLVNHGGKLWLGLASDHTDRKLEATSVAASKQACAKVCARDVWDFDALRDHVDQIALRSWIKEGADWVLYQEGHLDQIMPLTTLSPEIESVDQSAMLCGTLPAIGGVRPAADFKAELYDPVTDRCITLHYRATWLEEVS